MIAVSTPQRLFRGLLISCGLLAVVAAASSARAQIGSDRYASMVIDAQSGQVISAASPDDYRFPASLTKMMTIYMLFEALRDHRLSLSDAVPVSAWASSMPPTKLGLLPGTYLTVEQALLGLVTKSANDAASALGELMGGDEDRFAQMMTLRARALGMSHTTFRNASGLPDWGQVTTARDLLLLARHLIQDFPQYYHYFSTPSFQFHGRTVLSHQGLLRTYPGADGLKTGYTEASGFNVVTSATRGDVRLIGVVLGAAGGGERDVHMAALLDQGFLRMGVAPVEVARREPLYRLPFITAARAAAVAEGPEPRWAGVAHRSARRSTTKFVAVRSVPVVAPSPSRAHGSRAALTRARSVPRAAGARAGSAYRAAGKAHPASRVAAKTRTTSRVAAKAHSTVRVAATARARAQSAPTRTAQGTGDRAPL
jgi:D-alanyl-D-alanine carboxypeptidase